MSIHGTCLCGSVRYALDGPFDSMLHCHCSICRKHHGAAFATFVTLSIDQLHWLTPEADVARYRSSDGAERRFCPTCGSIAPSLVPELGLAFCPAGNLQGELALRPQYHMFVGSKAPWYEITDSLPQHRAFPPAWGGTETTRVPRAATDTLSGSCLCGAITFEVTGTPFRMVNCHCSRCRRSRSAAHATNLAYDAASFRYTSGAQHMREYKLPESDRFVAGFCALCGGGSPRTPRKNIAVIAAALFDRDPGVRASAHIFVGSKASWFEITDPLPQHESALPSQ